ncbi:MAG: FtsK/SpoIIIE domain-containing protein [Halarcobacter sp.]
MFYGIFSFFKSLTLWGLVSSSIFFLLLYIQNQPLDQDLTILYLIFSIILIQRIYFYSRYWKYIILPYSINLHNNFKDDGSNRSLFLDRFISFQKIKQKRVLDSIICKDLDQFELEYKNFIAIDIDNYRQHTEHILHFLDLIDNKYEVKVHHKKDRSIVLSFYKLPIYYEVDASPFFKSNKLFLGMYEKGLYYRDLDTLDHHLIVGESGGGKSNFMQLLNINFLFNLHKIKKMYMVDLKGGVELKRFENLDKVEFVSDVHKLNSLLDNVLEDLKKSQEEMIKTNTRKTKELTLIIFDEIGAVSVYKKIKDEIFNKLSLIAMQGRSSSILIFAYTQKIDTTVLPSSVINNLQSRILLKTSNDYNINIIDLKDNIRENISWVEVQDFNKGRTIFKDGMTSEKSLLQIPYIEDKFLDQFISYDMENISRDLQRKRPL